MNQLWLTVLMLVSLVSVPASAAPAATALPNILIIGDSISIGYTPFVTEILAGQAMVKRNPGNGQHTGTGLAKLDGWLGAEKWDVIHFNWGLWDLCYRAPESKVQGNRDKVKGVLTTSLRGYEQNLDQLVTRLKRTGAKLIWAHTTVVPEGEEGRWVGDDRKYNAAAARVMQKHGVAINDLNTVSRALAPDHLTAPNDVHFTSAGYKQLAEAVAASVVTALRQTK